MSTTEDTPQAELASTANGDQPAEAAQQATEPTAAAAAELEAAPDPQLDSEQEKVDSKPPNAKAKTSPAKAKASEPVQSGQAPSGRRERKQTAFFQPQKITETEKLEIKEVGSPFHTSYSIGFVLVKCISPSDTRLLAQLNIQMCSFTMNYCADAAFCRAKAPSLARFQMVGQPF